MINFRFHVVSIVAVFLALAIGIAMGTTVIDKVTVDTLRSQLETIEEQRDDARTSADQLTAELNALRDQMRELGAQGTSELLADRLDGVPVVVVATRGVDKDSVDGLRSALNASGASDGGTLWLTDKLALTDPSQVQTLSDTLGLSTADAARARTSLVGRLTAEFLDAASPPIAEGVTTTTTSDPGIVDPTTTSTTAPGTPPGSTTTSSVQTEEIALLQALHDGGFVDWDAPQAASADAVSLPAEGARFVFVSGPGAQVPDTDIVLPVLQSLAASGIAPVVAAQPSTGTAEEVAKNRTVFVGAIRGDDVLKTRVSTIDDLESFVGWAAVVLALEHLPQGQVGHYGVGDGAERLLPASTGSS
jgi:Copper transport outer membrane protein, MctB